MNSNDKINITTQNNRTLYVLIYLLNFQLRKVAELSGVILSGSSFSIDANSDIRRTCNLNIVPTNSDFDVANNSNIWIDKYIQVFVGIKNNQTQEVDYNNMGIYLINNPTRTYNAQSHTLSISGIDMMAKLTGMRNGYLSGTAGGVNYKIPAGSDIKDAIISTFGLGGFDNVIIDDFKPTPTVPNDIIISVGSTIYAMLKELVDINSFYQMYFDVNGLPHVDRIPSGDNEHIKVRDDIWQKLLIQYNNSVSFEEVKNVVEVYGKTSDEGITPYAIAIEDNPQSPFYAYGTAGQLRIVLSGGDYDNIYTTELAQQRADYELYLRCRLQDQVTITTVPIYWLDVNWLVEITLPNKQGTEITEKYIIKKIDTTIGENGTQNITMIKYYPTDV